MATVSKTGRLKSYWACPECDTEFRSYLLLNGLPDGAYYPIKDGAYQLRCGHEIEMARFHAHNGLESIADRPRAQRVQVNRLEPLRLGDADTRPSSSGPGGSAGYFAVYDLGESASTDASGREVYGNDERTQEGSERAFNQGKQTILEDILSRVVAKYRTEE